MNYWTTLSKHLLLSIDIVMCGKSSEIKILRCDFITDNKPVEKKDNCNDYIFFKITNYEIYGNYCRIFKANKTIKYINKDKSIDGLQKIDFYFNINTTQAEANAIEIASLSIQLTSPG